MEINEIEGRRVGLTTLHSKSGYGDGPITMGGGVYESLNGREEWTGCAEVHGDSGSPGRDLRRRADGPGG